jgi:hypothetical protein
MIILTSIFKSLYWKNSGIIWTWEQLEVDTLSGSLKTDMLWSVNNTVVEIRWTTFPLNLFTILLHTLVYFPGLRATLAAYTQPPCSPQVGEKRPSYCPPCLGGQPRPGPEPLRWEWGLDEAWCWWETQPVVCHQPRSRYIWSQVPAHGMAHRMRATSLTTAAATADTW